MPLRIFKEGKEQIIFFRFSEKSNAQISKCSRRLELEIPSRIIGQIISVSIMMDLSVEEQPLIIEPKNNGRTFEDASTSNFSRFGRKTSTGVSSKYSLILSYRFVKASYLRVSYDFQNM
jgi:hypothetical protein